MGRPTDQIGRRFPVRNQPCPLLGMQVGATHEVEQLVARQKRLGLGVILIGRFGSEDAQVNCWIVRHYFLH